MCWLPLMVAVPKTFPFKSFTARYSGLVTSQKIGRRKLTETTRNGTPRWIALMALPTAAWPAHAFDYPTSERVTYVEACMRENPGHHYEMLNKCSCVIDTIARELPYDDFVTMSTAANAVTIGGERGYYIRDVEPLQVQIRKFRQLQAQARKSCLLDAAR